MAINLATAYVAIVPSMKGVGKSINDAFGNVDTMPAGTKAGAAYAEGAQSGLGSLKSGAIAGIFQTATQTAIGYVQNLSGEMIEASDSAQKFASTLSFAGVDDSTIKNLTASTQEYADKTVFNLNDIRNTTAQLAANGVPNYEKLAEAAGNLTAVAGGGADAFASVAMALTQTAGAGKLTTENWNQIADAIPGASGKLQEAMKANGAYTGDFRDAMAKGQITADEFNQALMQLGMSDTAVQAAQSASTIEGASGNLEAAVTKFGSTVIDKAKPAITQLMNSMSDLVGTVTDKVGPAFDWLSQHGDQVKTAVIGVATAWGTLRTLMAVGSISNAVTAAGGMIPALTAWASNLNIVKAAQLALNGVVAIGKGIQAAFNLVLSMNPIMLVVIALAALTAGLIWFFTQTDLGRQAWQSFTTWLTTTWDSIKQTASAVFTGIGNAISSACDAVRNTWQSFTTWLTTTWDSIKQTASTVFTGIGNAISGAWNAVRNATTEAWNAIWTGFLQPILTTIGHAFYDIGIVIAAVFVTAWNAVRNVTVTVWNAIVGFLQPILNTIGNAISSACNAIYSAWYTAWNAVSNVVRTVWNAIVGFLQTILNTVWNAIVSACNAIYSAWYTAWNAISNVVRTVWNAIVGFLQPILNTIGNAISSACNAISRAWDAAWNAIGNVFRNAWNGMTGAVSSAANAIGSTVSGIKDRITGVFSDAGSWLSQAGRQVIQGLINGITGMAGAVKDKIEGLGHNVVGWAKGVLGINSPSRVFRDQVGRWIPAGMAAGITRNLSPVQQAMDTMGGLRPTGGMWAPSPAFAGTGVQALAGTGLQGMGVAQQQGDIIIPVYVGGSKLDEMVVTAARRADYRRG